MNKSAGAEKILRAIPKELDSLHGVGGRIDSAMFNPHHNQNVAYYNTVLESARAKLQKPMSEAKHQKTMEHLSKSKDAILENGRSHADTRRAAVIIGAVPAAIGVTAHLIESRAAAKAAASASAKAAASLAAKKAATNKTLGLAGTGIAAGAGATGLGYYLSKKRSPENGEIRSF